MQIQEDACLGKRLLNDADLGGDHLGQALSKAVRLTDGNLYTALEPNHPCNVRQDGIAFIRETVQDDKRIASKVVNKKFTFKNIFGNKKQTMANAAGGQNRLNDKFGNWAANSNEKILDPSAQGGPTTEPKNKITSKTRKWICKKITDKDLKYQDFLEMNSLWEEHLSQIIKNDKNPDMVSQKILHADFHGSFITVFKSKNPANEGLSGIFFFLKKVIGIV
jgi:hypothetical protein